MGKRIVIVVVAAIVAVAAAWAGRPLKVLAIGNSFSEDAVEQDLHDIVFSAGDSILIGNLYIGGCSIDRHYDNIVNDKPDYSYRKIGYDGQREIIDQHCTLERALKDEEWDVITFQQASQYSGIESSYSHLPALIQAVRKIVGTRPEFLWHMTWAYASDSNHSGFANYDHNQLAMYDAIVATAKHVLADNKALVGLIPSGTAIENARATELNRFGRELTRDGYHLNKQIGRYIAACTWYGVLFHDPEINTKYYPKGITPEEGALARWCARMAIEHPFEITLP